MHLEEMLESSEVDVLDRDVIDEQQNIVENVKYKDRGWQLKNVKIELVFDRRNGYLLRAFISVPSANDAITTQSLKDMLLRRLQTAGVLPKPSTSIGSTSVFAKTAAPEVRMPKFDHNKRQISGRFYSESIHDPATQGFHIKREIYRGVKRSSSYNYVVPRKSDDDDDGLNHSDLPASRERMSLP